MKNLFIFCLVAAVTASSCGKMGYKYAKSGMKYKIISNGGKDSLKQGDMIKLFLEQRIEDSVLISSKDAGHQMIRYDTNFAKQPYFFTEIMPFMKVGDSAVCILSTDSVRLKFYKGYPDEQIPPFLKPGKKLYLFGRIVKKYSDSAEFAKDAQAEAVLAQAFQQKAQERMMAEKQKSDAAGFKTSREELDKFLGDRKTTLQKTPGGVYVEMMEPGTGLACDSGKQVSIRYKGTLLNGEEFDSNFEKPGDSVKKPAFIVTMGQGGAIPGFMEGVKMLRKGSRAKIYIPSELGYGGQAASDKLKAYSNLIFELYIEDVTVPKKMANVQSQPAPEKPTEDHTGHDHK